MLNLKIFADGTDRIVITADAPGIAEHIDEISVLTSLIEGINTQKEKPSTAKPIASEPVASPVIPAPERSQAEEIKAEDNKPLDSDPYASLFTEDKSANYKAFKSLVPRLKEVKGEEKKALNAAICRYIKDVFPKGFDAEAYAKSLSKKQMDSFFNTFGMCISEKKRADIIEHNGFASWEHMYNFEDPDLRAFVCADIIRVFSK